MKYNIQVLLTTLSTPNWYKNFLNEKKSNRSRLHNNKWTMVSTYFWPRVTVLSQYFIF